MINALCVRWTEEDFHATIIYNRNDYQRIDVEAQPSMAFEISNEWQLQIKFDEKKNK